MIKRDIIDGNMSDVIVFVFGEKGIQERLMMMMSTLGVSYFLSCDCFGYFILFCFISFSFIRSLRLTPITV